MTTFITTILLVFGNLFLEPEPTNSNNSREDVEQQIEQQNVNGKKILIEDILF